MTLEQVNNLEFELRMWRMERKLYTTDQQYNLIANVLEELTELARAKSNDERIDAICDIGVFYLNSLDNKITELTDCYELDKGLEEKFKRPRAIGFLAEELLSLILYTEIYTKPYRVLDFLEQCAKGLGYDFYKCMMETIQEINSRTGHYDESIGKFVKDDGAYEIDDCAKLYPFNIKIIENSNCFDVWIKEGEVRVVKKWYKANYDSCKLEG